MKTTKPYQFIINGKSKTLFASSYDNAVIKRLALLPPSKPCTKVICTDCGKCKN